jgi:hypothetical protein
VQKIKRSGAVPLLRHSKDRAGRRGGRRRTKPTNDDDDKKTTTQRGRRRGQHRDHGGLPCHDLATMARILVTPRPDGNDDPQRYGRSRRRGMHAPYQGIVPPFGCLCGLLGGHRPGIPEDRGGNVPEYRQYEHNNSDYMRGRTRTFDTQGLATFLRRKRRTRNLLSCLFVSALYGLLLIKPAGIRR